MENNAIIIVGLLINFGGVLFSIFLSRIKLERRITRLETLIGILVRNKNIRINSVRESDSDDTLSFFTQRRAAK